MLALARALAFPLLLVPSVLHAGLRRSEGPPPVLHITTYRSPSGHYALTVDPSRLHGGGPGAYRVEKANQLAWEKQLDFTFWEAAITDDGAAVGYAYSSGWRGHDGPRDGDIIVAILNPDGSTRFLDRRPRNESRAMHSPPEPTAVGCFLDQASDRFVVRFWPAEWNGGERWEVYSVSKGERLKDVTLAPPAPRDEGPSYVAVDARIIPGADLALVTWSRTQWQPRQTGVRFSLVDRDARELASLERPEEFSGIESYSPWRLKHSNLLPVVAPQSFSFRSPAEQARLTFSLTRDAADPKRWLIKETARNPEAISTDRAQDPGPPLPPIALTPRGTVALQVANDHDAQPLRVSEFDFDPTGRIGFTTRTSAGGIEFVLYAPDGTRLKSIPLNDVPKVTPPRAVCIGDVNWILFSCPPGDDAKPSAYSLDAAAGTLAPLKDFECPSSYARTTKGTAGRFAVLGDHRDQRAVAFDAAGKALWSLPNPVFSAEDIAFNSRGELGALGNISNLIAVYDVNGKLNRQIELNVTLGRAPNYVSGLESDADGGWILHDFSGTPPIYRLDPNGKVLSSFTPRFPDGRTFSIYSNVKRAPDGRLWTSDSASLLRLTDDGVVDFIIGRQPGNASLGEIRSATIDAKGDIYAVDAHNAFVHVFDSQGKALRILKPDPTDFTSSAGIGSITVAGDGGVYYFLASHAPGNQGYLRINADGSRAGFQDRISDEVVDEWCFRPGSQERLVLGYERAFLVDAMGEKVRTIERRADRRWLDHPQGAAFAPDGSFIIIAAPSNWRDGDSSSITYFAPNGDARRTFNLPGSMHYADGATNAKTIVVTSGENGVVIDIATGDMKHWKLPPECENSWWSPRISPDGAELWCFDYEKKSVFRFAMP